MRRIIAGVDGCTGGWLAVVQADRGLQAQVARDLETLLDAMPEVVIGIDIPIGLPDRGPRACDLHARKLLGRPRGTSVFPVPIRACLKDRDYSELSLLHKQVDGRGLTRQAFHLLPRSDRLMISFAHPGFPIGFGRCTRRSRSHSGTTGSRCASTRRSLRRDESANASSIANGPVNENALLDSFEEVCRR